MKKKYSIRETFIIDQSGNAGSGTTSCELTVTNLLQSCSGDTTISMESGAIVVSSTIIPETDNTSDLGITSRRFRQLNSISGTSTYWSTQSLDASNIRTNMIDLGTDSQNNLRILNADSSVLANDTVVGGSY